MPKPEIIAKPIATPRDAEDVAARLDRFEGIAGQFRALLAMIRDPDYRFPFRVKAMLTLAALYVISPVDLIPEGIFLIFGLADDLAVIATTLALLSGEINAYIKAKSLKHELPPE